LIAQRELIKYPGSAIIYNLISSRAVAEVVKENGGVALRSRVGHSYIKAMMAESGAIFGGEHSGHFYFKEFWRADSGALAALYAIAALGESKDPMSKIMAPYQRYVSSGEINSTVTDADLATLSVEARFSQKPGVEIDHLDGLSVIGDTWWFNLRPSNTEPLLRLNVEAKSAGAMSKLRDEVLSIIRG
jgi:phosphomannomutase